MSAVSGIAKPEGRVEEAMNCRNCNTTINYNYVADCPQCGSAVAGGDLPKLDPSTGSGQKESVWPYRLVNVIYVLLTAGVGMISGAVVFYFSGAVLNIAFSSPETYPGESCARGTAIAMLTILTGGFLGTVGGSVFGVKHPVGSKRQSKQQSNP